MTMGHDPPEQPVPYEGGAPVAHSTSPARIGPSGATEETSIGTLVQSAMADISTLVRSEVELAKAEVGKSAKKAGIGAGAFGAAGVGPAVSRLFFRPAPPAVLTPLRIGRSTSHPLLRVLPPLPARPPAPP